MKKVLLAAAIVVLAGCGGDSASLSSARFAGTYDGTWVNLDDASDAGTAHWTYSSDGTVSGQDFDPGRNTTFTIAGKIDSLGALTSTSTPVDGSPATLNGGLAFDTDGKLTGILSWGVTPVLRYRYTFTRATPL